MDPRLSRPFFGATGLTDQNVTLNWPLIVFWPDEAVPGRRVAENEPDAPVDETDVTVMVPLPKATSAIQLPVPP
jgi:hypothetical protein